MTQPQDSASDSSRPDDAGDLRTYEKPELSVYGSIEEVTEASGISGLDGLGGPQAS